MTCSCNVPGRGPILISAYLVGAYLGTLVSCASRFEIYHQCTNDLSKARVRREHNWICKLVVKELKRRNEMTKSPSSR